MSCNRCDWLSQQSLDPKSPNRKYALGAFRPPPGAHAQFCVYIGPHVCRLSVLKRTHCEAAYAYSWWEEVKFYV